MPLIARLGEPEAILWCTVDAAMDEIYALVDEVFKGGQEKVQLQAFPFRMTARNLASHASDPNTPFWEMLKAGSDAFLAAEQPPKVAVCDRRYVFNAAVATDLDPSGPCPLGIDTIAVAEAHQPGQPSSGSTPSNMGALAYRADDAIAEKLRENLKGVY